MIRINWRRGKLAALLIAAMSVCSAANPLQTLARAATFPARAVVNVRDYGAKGDGVTDDTRAIHSAIAQNLGSGATLYLPNGTYLVSDRLGWQRANGDWWCFLSLIGQSRSGTIIKLKPNSPGFTDAERPRAVIKTASLNPREGNEGADNDAYRNHIEDLTIDVGTGNAGAIGLDWNATNEGGLRNVSIKARGVAKYGLALMWDSSLGPNFIGNLSVEGFNYGVYASQYFGAGSAIDGLTLRGQSIAGVYNSRMALSIRGLKSQNSVPAAITDNDSLTTVIGARCVGGSAGRSAFETMAEGDFFGRDMTTSGYASAIKKGAGVVKGSRQIEYSSGGAVSLFPSAGRSLGLPIQNAPTFHETDLRKWANVEDFGARANDHIDDSDAIQKAIDSGATTIYFPTEKDRGGLHYLTRLCHIAKPVKVRGAARRIWGGNCELSWPTSAGNTFVDPNNPRAFLRVENTSGPGLSRFCAVGVVEKVAKTPLRQAASLVIKLLLSSLVGGTS